MSVLFFRFQPTQIKQYQEIVLKPSAISSYQTEFQLIGLDWTFFSYFLTFIGKIMSQLVTFKTSK